MKNVFALAGAIALSSAVVGCVGTFDRIALLRPEAAHVEAVTIEPQGCRSLGELTAMGRSEIDRQAALDSAQNELRNQAHDLGASHVQITNTDQRRSAAAMWGASTRVEMTGVAFQCPAAGSPAERLPEASTPTEASPPPNATATDSAVAE
jgi:hypothetical protein